MKSIKLKVLARKEPISDKLTLAKFISTDADHQANAIRLISGWLEGHPNGIVEVVVDTEELSRINQVMKSTRISEKRWEDFIDADKAHKPQDNAALVHCNELLDNEHFGAFTALA